MRADKRMFNSYSNYLNPLTNDDLKKLNAFSIHLGNYDATVAIPNSFKTKKKMDLTIYVPGCEIKHVIGSNGSNINDIKKQIANNTNASYNNISIKVKNMLEDVNKYNMYGKFHYLHPYLDKHKDTYARLESGDGNVVYMFNNGIYEDSSKNKLLISTDDMIEDNDHIEKWFSDVTIYFKDTDKLFMVTI